ncbi:MAG TPA: nucleotidyltransferase family protein [bacterium]|nr:nucleotidyltransferase family protein [bacterium]
MKVPKNIFGTRAAMCLLTALESERNEEARRGLATLVEKNAIPWREMLPGPVAPLMWDIIDRAGMSSMLKEELREALEARFIAQTGKNIAMLEAMGKAAAALNGAGIIPAPLKGAALIISGVYARPGRRAMTDIDLLVSPEEFPAAEKAMRGAGFRESAPKRGHHATYAAPPPFPVIVELHRRLFDRDNPVYRYAYGMDGAKAAARASRAAFKGCDILLFSPEDMFLHIVCHAAKERFGSLKFIADARLLKATFPIDEDKLADAAAKAGCGGKLRKTVKYVDKVEFIQTDNIIGKCIGPDDNYYTINRPADVARERSGERRDAFKTARSAVGEFIYQMGQAEGVARKAAAVALMPGYLRRRWKRKPDVPQDESH